MPTTILARVSSAESGYRTLSGYRTSLKLALREVSAARRLWHGNDRRRIGELGFSKWQISCSTADRPCRTRWVASACSTNWARFCRGPGSANGDYDDDQLVRKKAGW